MDYIYIYLGLLEVICNQHQQRLKECLRSSSLLLFLILEGKQSLFLIKYDVKYRFFIGSTDAEAEAPVLWPLDVKNQLTGKDPDAGKD